jgi:hypothetical protein
MAIVASACAAAQLLACTDSGSNAAQSADAGRGGSGRDAAAAGESGRDARVAGDDAAIAGRDAATPGRDAATAGMDGGAGDAAASGSDAGTHAQSDAGTSACPEGASGTAPADYLVQFHSGSRLEARYWTADGMPDVFAGFFDTDLGFACDFTQATDGELRCLPRDAARLAQLGFTDDQCVHAAWQTSAECASAHGYVRLATECHDEYAVAQLEPLAAAATQYVAQGAGCAASGSMIEPSATTFVASAPLDPSAFVAGTLRVLPGVCRGSVRVVEAEDGAAGPYELVDVAHDFACDRIWGAGVSSCAPARRANVDPTLFSDADCTEPATFGTWADGPSCRPPDVIFGALDNAWYEVGGPRTRRSTQARAPASPRWTNPRSEPYSRSASSSRRPRLRRSSSRCRAARGCRRTSCASRARR